MSIFKKVSAFLTAVGIAAAFTGCSDTRYGLEVDDVKVPAGIYIYYANSAYNNALSMLKAENPELDTEDVKAVKAASLEGVDTLTWIHNKATELCVSYVAVEKKFDELGLTLDDDAKANLDFMMDYYWSSYEASMTKNGISEDSFSKIMTSSYKSEAIFEYYYGTEGELGVSEDELKKYYLDNNIRAEYVAFNLYDGAGNLLKTDGKKDMMKMVKAYKERVEDAYDDGGVEAVMTEMSVVQEEYKAYCTSISEEAAGVTGTTTTTTTAATTTTTETTTAESADATDETAETTVVTETDENGSAVTVETTTTEATTTTTAAEGSSDETTTSTVSFPNERIIPIINEEDYEEGDEIPYSPSEKAYKDLLAIKEKDYGKPYIVEEDEVYYLIVRYDLEDRATEKDLWNEDQIYSVQVSMFGEDFDEMIKEWSDKMNVVRNEAAYKRYDPFKFDM
ncbi:MAG: hypothetical protein E7504_05260 [Ruminococcus sp.]|nr:hypothetical protein [Ruminococcus sp.]